MPTLWRLFAILLLLALAAVPSAPAPVSAHVFLFKSVPGDGDVLDSAPAQVTAEFTGEVYPTGSVLSVFSADGVEVDNGDTVVDPDNAKRLIVTLPALPPGSYHTSWTAVDTLDGHP